MLTEVGGQPCRMFGSAYDMVQVNYEVALVLWLYAPDRKAVPQIMNPDMHTLPLH